jgi:dienelactone hydrolase
MHHRSLRLIATAALAALCFGFASQAAAALKTEAVAYQAGAVQAKGLLVYDDATSAKRPGVLVVPEWWGLNDYVIRRARMLAGLGYVALAVDMYGGGRHTDDAKQAEQWSHALESGDRSELHARIAAALGALRRDPRVDAARTAAIGYCFGGLTVLELARSGAGLTGVVSFHGPLGTPDPARPGAIRARVLVCTGADDPYVPPAAVQAFEDEMRKAGANFEINIYSGARHSFTNPAADRWRSPDLGYNPQADRRSWQAMRDFFAEIFRR